MNQGFPCTFRNILPLSLTVVSMKNAEEFGVFVSQFGYGIFLKVLTVKAELVNEAHQ